MESLYQVTKKTTGGITEFLSARSKEYISLAKDLIEEYITSNRLDVAAEEIENELKEFVQDYAAPYGDFIVALHNNQVAGGIGIKQVGGHGCEIRRLFVRADFKDSGLANELITNAIKRAKVLGYKTVKVVLQPNSKEEFTLYRELGFTEIPRFRYNPLRTVISMRFYLTTDGLVSEPKIPLPLLIKRNPFRSAFYR